MPLAPNRNNSALSHESPSSSFISASHSSDCFAVRMPPAGLKPTAISVSCAYSRIARVMTRLTGRVAFVASLPVDVLMKSAPAIIATSFHRAPNFRDAFLERGKTRRESRRDRCNMNAATLDSAPRGFDEGVINAHGSDLDVEALDAKPLNEFALDRLSRLGA